MIPDRRVYLKMTDPNQALALLLDRATDLPEPPTEIVPTAEALDRVTAAAVYAPTSSPTFLAAAMDGYAVKSHLTFTASEAEPVTLTIPDEATPVDTGDALPAGKDAVYKIEELDQ